MFSFLVVTLLCSVSKVMQVLDVAPSDLPMSTVQSQFQSQCVWQDDNLTM